MTATLPMRRVGLADVCHHAVFLHQEIYVQETLDFRRRFFCLSLEISRDREMKDKSGPLPPKNPTAGTWNWWLPIFSPLPSFPGKPCFVFPVVHPKNFGESLLDWNIVRRLFSRWGLQILSRKAGQRWKMMTEDAIFCVCPPPPPKKKVRPKKNSGDVGDEIFSGVESKSPFFGGI